MILQQPYLPKDKPATGDEVWGYSFWQFLAGNWEYLLGILLVLGVFLFARYSWRKRHEKEKEEWYKNSQN